MNAASKPLLYTWRVPGAILGWVGGMFCLWLDNVSSLPWLGVSTHSQIIIVNHVLGGREMSRVTLQQIEGCSTWVAICLGRSFGRLLVGYWFVDVGQWNRLNLRSSSSVKVQFSITYQPDTWLYRTVIPRIISSKNHKRTHRAKPTIPSLMNPVRPRSRTHQSRRAAGWAITLVPAI